MSDINDREVIDLTYVEGTKYVLVILDTLEWNFGNRDRHRTLLKDKINDYLLYIASGQAREKEPDLKPVIRIIAQYPISSYGLDFLERSKQFIQTLELHTDLEWDHDEVILEDGFSDDYVFDSQNIFPRIKKNWAENPLEEVKLMAFGNEESDYSNLVMIRLMDSFVGLFLVDVGDSFIYLTYDMLPEDFDVSSLQKIAFSNLVEQVTFRRCESNVRGVYGIWAAGDFEAESICFPSLWKSISNDLKDDVLISIPTKDVVFYTKANNFISRYRMLKMAKEMFETNQKETPHLLFCKDVWLYSREDDSLKILEDVQL